MECKQLYRLTRRLVVEIQVFETTPLVYFDLFFRVLGPLRSRCRALCVLQLVRVGKCQIIKVDHYRPLEAVLAAFEMIFTGKKEPRRSRYASDSVHLRGFDNMPESEAMWVEQGTRLGEMDNTSLSVLHHLNFAFRDSQQP